MTAASIGSVLARLPSAWAKARTCAGLTTTTGRAGRRQARRHDGLEAARRLDRDQSGRKRLQPLDQLLQPVSVPRHGEGLAAGAT